MDMLEGETEIRDYALERAMMLSDGVFAIAMTLLALDLRPPEHWDRTMAGLWNAMALPFQSFFWSFFSISIFWITHRRMFGAYRRADGVITAINLVLLGEIVLVPPSTLILTQLHYTPGALGLYLGLFALIGTTNAASWTYAAFIGHLLRPPRRGPAVKLTIAVFQAFLPVTMTACGVLSPQPGLHFLPLLIPVVFAATVLCRRAAEAIDRRNAPTPLPSHPSTVQVDRTSR